MHRFWIFPLILALVGACLPLFVLAESILPISAANATLFYPSTYSPSLTLAYLTKEVLEAWKVILPYAAGIGFIMGVGMALSDWFRNGYRQSEGLASRLILNLLWCGIYATALVTLDSAFFWLLFSKVTLSPHWSFTRLFPLLFSAAMALSAMLWASFLTVTSADVLTPQVLGAKLKLSTRVQG